MEANVKVAIEAINKFMFHSWNYTSVPVQLFNGQTVYVPEFVKEVDWTCNLDHMASKWVNCTECGNPHAYISKFYGELGSENRKLMIEWILQHYNNEIKIFPEEK